MKTLSQAKSYLETGYELIVNTNRKRNYFCGYYVLPKDNQYYATSFFDVYEVDVNEIIKYFPSLQEKIRQNQWLKVIYNQEQGKFISTIIHRNKEKPFMIIVEDLIVETESLLEGWQELNRTIAKNLSFLEEIPKKQIKKIS